LLGIAYRTELNLASTADVKCMVTQAASRQHTPAFKYAWFYGFATLKWHWYGRASQHASKRQTRIC